MIGRLLLTVLKTMNCNDDLTWDIVSSAIAYCSGAGPLGEPYAVDVLCVLAGCAGEALLNDVSLFDYQSLRTVDGLHFSDKDIQPALTGLSPSLSSCPQDSLFGYVGAGLRAAEFGKHLPDLRDVFVGFEKIALGHSLRRIPMGVPPQIRPRLNPFQAVYELRPTMDAIMDLRSNEQKFNQPYWEPFALATVCALLYFDRRAKAQDRNLKPHAVRLIFDTMNAFAKTKPLEAMPDQRPAFHGRVLSHALH